MEDREYKVDEIIIIPPTKEIKLKVIEVEGLHCNGCYYNASQCRNSYGYDHCLDKLRKDNKNVIFKEVK